MSADRSKELQSLLKRLSGSVAAPPPEEPAPLSLDPGEPLLGLFVRSFFLWEAAGAKAAAAVKRLEQAVVDYNELRVCLIPELIRIIGDRYPRAEERCRRLKNALNDVYRREHCVSLARLAEMQKRDAKSYLEGVSGTPRYVASRVLLLGLDAHAAPVDERLLKRLIDAGLADEGSSPDEAAAFLEHHIRAGELAPAHALFQAWTDEPAKADSDDRRPKPAPRRPRPKAADAD